MAGAPGAFDGVRAGGVTRILGASCPSGAAAGFAPPAQTLWVGAKISVPRPMIAPPATNVHWVRNSCIRKSIGVFTDLLVATGRTGVTL